MLLWQVPYVTTDSFPCLRLPLSACTHTHATNTQQWQMLTVQIIMWHLNCLSTTYHSVVEVPQFLLHRDHLSTIQVKRSFFKSYQPGATVVTVIISSDKTQLTLFHGKSAYWISHNLKHSKSHLLLVASPCCAQMSLAWRYHTSDMYVTAMQFANLYHSCMQIILAWSPTSWQNWHCNNEWGWGSGIGAIQFLPHLLKTTPNKYW